MKDCTYYWNLISAQMDHALTAEEERLLAAHLAECSECRELAEQMRMIHEDISEIEMPSVGFVDAVMAEVDETEQEIPFTALPQNRRSGKRGQEQVRMWWKPIRNWAAIAACCLLILGVGKWIGNISMGSAQPKMAQSEAATVQDVNNAAPAAAAEPELAAGSDLETMDLAPAEPEMECAMAEESLEESCAVADYADAEYIEINGRQFVRSDEVMAELPDISMENGTISEDNTNDQSLEGLNWYLDAENEILYLEIGDGFEVWE